MSIFNSVSIGESICIDPGSEYTSIYISGRGTALREPSAVAININTGAVEAVGAEAADMEERGPRTMKTARPIQGGAVTDEELAGQLFSGLLAKVKKNGVVKPKVMVTVPCGATDVEEKALINSVMRAGARQVLVIEAPVAAALGAGCDVTIARGLMVLDIGAGKTETAAISLCNSVASRTVKMGGINFTDDVLAFVRKKYNMEIGRAAANKLKENAASLAGGYRELYEVSGIDLSSRLPRKIRISPAETETIFDAHVDAAAKIIKEGLESVPPEILGDILEDGILMVGGGAKLDGLAAKLREKSGIKIFPAENIEQCTIRGAGIAMENLSALPNIAKSYHNL